MYRVSHFSSSSNCFFSGLSIFVSILLLHGSNEQKTLKCEYDVALLSSDLFHPQITSNGIEKDMKSASVDIPIIVDTHQYDLVLFTTEDGFSAKTIGKMNLFRDMCELYSHQFNFRAILFTTTHELISFFKNTSVVILNDYKINPYGMPIITSLFKKSQILHSKYYGYLNSDILIEPTIFQILQYCQQNVKLGQLTEIHEIAGRVYEVDHSFIPSSFISYENFTNFFKSYVRKRKYIRNRGSADYFIFSYAAMFYITDDKKEAVIGRMQIDNFLMGSMCNETDHKPKELLDATMVVLGIHEGKDGFYNRKPQEQTRQNKGWNYGVMHNNSIHYGYLSEKGNRALQMRDGKCCALVTYK